MKIKAAFILAYIITSPLFVWSQYQSTVWQYPNHTGTNVISRTNHGHFQVVTSAKSPFNNSFFIVDDGSFQRYFYTLPNGIFVPDSGYFINDMRVVDNRCWFCGQKWKNTGQIIYNLDGTSYWVKAYCGFIGRFDVTEALAGSGTYEIIPLDSVYNLTRMDAYYDGVVAVGESWKHKSCMVELYENILGTAYNCKMNTPNSDEEVFMDVVNANGRIVTLSRFNNPNYYFHYHALYGLRYGSAGNFGTTASNLYRYDTYSIFGDDRAYFSSLEPIFLAYTNKQATDITVSYVVTYNAAANSLKERMVTYHVIGEGTAPTDVLFHYDGQKYSKLKDVKFNFPITNNTHMTVLAEDNSGVSTLRFPQLNLSYFIYSDTSLKMTDPKIESVVPFQYMSNGLDVFTAGYYPNSANKIAGISELNIHSHLPFWNTMNCYSLSTGTMQSITVPDYTPSSPAGGITQRYLGSKIFEQHQYTSSSVTPTIKCLNGSLY